MATAWKTIKVFISSTFHGMHSERDYLAKIVFPELRDRLSTARIHLVDIDLRWGVTAQQSESGQALSVCLDLIEECAPFFVGILGERYGHPLSPLPAAAARRQGREWLENRAGHSITALEIEHAVLRDPRLCDRSLFYFRDPAFATQMPACLWPWVKPESPGAAEAQLRLKERLRHARLGHPAAEEYPCAYAGVKIMRRIARMELPAEDWEALDGVARRGWIDAARFARLDERLQAIAMRFGYLHLENLQTFGARVREDLWQSIQASHPELNARRDRRFPRDALRRNASMEKAGLDDEILLHEHFFESQAQGYIPRPEIEQRLRKRAQTANGRSIWLTGAPGSGKTALLCWFCRTIRNERPTACLVSHFVGASPMSGELRLTLRRLCLELKRLYAFSDRVPREIQDLSPTFRQFLAQIPEHRPLVLVVDGVDHFGDDHEPGSFSWLPNEVPAHVTVMLGSAARPDSSPEENAGSRPPRWPAREAATSVAAEEDLVVGPLSDEERLRYVREIPLLSSKSLDDDQVGLLLENEATRNPLFLQVALDELRGFGARKFLNQHILSLPRAPACEQRDAERPFDPVLAMFQEVLKRLEEDFSPQAARRTLMLLASARQGLSEKEIEEIVNGSRPNGASRDAILVMRQLRTHLEFRGGLIGFRHRALRQAVQARYLRTSGRARAAHIALAGYFRDHARGHRRTAELPWQWAEAGRWNELAATLADLGFFRTAWRNDPLEVKRFWTAVEERSGNRIPEAYGRILASSRSKRGTAVLRDLARLFRETRYPRESLVVWTRLATRYEQEHDFRNLALARNNRGLILKQTHSWPEARIEFEAAARIAREHDCPDVLRRAIANLAVMAYELGDRDEALQHYREEANLCRRLGDRKSLAANLSNQAGILLGAQMHDPNSGHDRLLASALDEAEQVNRDLGSAAGLQRILAMRATRQAGREEWRAALKTLEELAILFKRIGNRSDLARVVANMATAHAHLGERDAAMDLCTQARGMFQEIGDLVGLARVAGQECDLYEEANEFEKALCKREDQANLLGRVEDWDGVVRCLLAQADLLAFELEDRAEAARRCLQARAVARNIPSAESRARLIEAIDDQDERMR